MISAIKTWMFNKSLRKHQNYQRKQTFTGVNKCDTICLLSNGTIERTREATESYQAKLGALNKKVDVLYFFDAKSEVEEGYSRQSVKWNGIPQHENVDVILAQEYDVMMFLNPTMPNHFRFLTTLCNARFKIGPNIDEAEDLFDLMIDIEDLGNTQLLIKNINQQLKLLSS